MNSGKTVEFDYHRQFDGGKRIPVDIPIEAPVPIGKGAWISILEGAPKFRIE